MALAGTIGKRAGEEGLAGSRDSDEERIDALGEEREVVQRQVARAKFLADGIKVEVEAIDGVELGEPRVLDAAVDRALEATRTFLVAEPVKDLEVGQVVFAGLLEQ